MKSTVKIVAAMLLLAGTTSTVLASNVPPASSGPVAVVGAFFGGTLLNSATTFVSTPSYSGWARAAVYDTGTGMDFYYQFSNLATSISGVERLTAYDYKNYAVDAYQTPTAFGIFQTGTENIDLVDRGSLGVIGFNFIPTGSTKIQPGTSSYIGILRTNARGYTTGSFGVIDGYAGNAVAFAPAVPEPETYAMMLLGLGALSLFAKHRAKATELINKS
ncbi:MAG: PEP-CTERM sorting domain-containing protein [Burkholderiales bacterium]|nr:PEP-CTERM sorting domain-containing protein [Burkholderiales bacterium]